MDNAQRIPLPRDDELDDYALALLETRPPLNIAKMLARTGMAPEFYGCVRKIFDDTWFPAHDREIMVMSWFNMLSRFVDSTGIPVGEGADPYKNIAGPASQQRNDTS